MIQAQSGREIPRLGDDARVRRAERGPLGGIRIGVDVLDTPSRLTSLPWRCTCMPMPCVAMWATSTRPTTPRRGDVLRTLPREDLRRRTGRRRLVNLEPTPVWKQVFLDQHDRILVWD
jgi:hypothetical protein